MAGTILTLEQEVPFDQYSRQFQVSEILKTLRHDGKPLTILDVGGYKGRTQDFLHQDKVTIVDLFDVTEENYVKGSALELPFEAESFDFVLSFDVLEHIAPADRETFIVECTRVSKRGIIICAPSKSPENELIETRLDDLYRRLHHKPHRWLKEHRDYGIPDFDLAERMAKKGGLFTSRFYSNKSQLWFMMQHAIFINSKFPFGTEKLIELNEFYNNNFKYDGGGPGVTSYRQILCGLKDKKDVSQLISKMGKANKPIDPILELELLYMISEYFTVLTLKTSQLAKDYEDLYEFHKRLAESHEKTSQELADRLKKVENILPVKLAIKTKSTLHRTRKTQ